MKRKQKKGLAALLLSLALTAELLSGCASDRSDNEQTPDYEITDMPVTKGASEDDASQPPAGTAQEPTEIPERVFDAFDELSAAEITKELGAGWNLGNSLEASSNGRPSEAAWGNAFNSPEILQMVREAGFSAVRIPVSYLNYIGSEEDGYVIDEKWLQRVNTVVDYAIDAGLYVIINIHGDGYRSVNGAWLFPDEADQTEILAKYEAVWKQIAERFADYDEHLIFESMNEVGSESSCNAALYANMNAYNRIFTDTVRQTGGNNDRRWLLIPGYNTNIDKTTDDSGFEIPEDSYLSELVPTGEHRIMISVHYYDPWSFCGGENDEATQWGVDAEPGKIANWGDEAYMEQQFAKLYSKFSSQGYPVIIGEYGAIDKSRADDANNYYRAYFAAKLCEKAIRYGLVPVYWDNGYNGNYGFAIFNRNLKTVTQPEIIEAIMSAFDTENVTGGTATAIVLSESELFLSTVDAGIQLTAELTPQECTDIVLWSSSNDSVVTVSSDGMVKPKGEGTAVITASCNGLRAECQVTVAGAEATAVGLYLLETNGWQTAAGAETVVLSEDGTYVLEMEVSAAVLENIGSFYIKDVQVQSALLNKSLLKSGIITIDSVEINQTALTMRETAADRAAISGGSFDICMLNRWAAGTEMFDEFQMTEDGDYQFDHVEIGESNLIRVTFTVSGLTY